MNRREFLATASGVAAAGFFPRVCQAHLGAHEGRFATGGLTLISGYCAEGHHLVGQAVVELISQHVSAAKRSQLTVVANSADTLKFLRARHTDTPYGRFTADLALVEGDEAYGALKGTGSRDAGGLGLLTLLPAQYLHIVTLGESPIRSVGELKGKTVSVGPARSRSEKLMFRLLEALDPSVGTSLQRAALGLSESMWALAEKKIDAFAWHGPVSPALFEHLAALLKIRLALLSYEEGVSKLREKYGTAYSPALIRQGAYAWLEKEVRVAGTQNLLISRLDLPDQTAYEIVKTLNSHRDAFTGGDRRLSDISAGPDTYMPFPVHPGALKFRNEM
jgi:TRAP transporter TAXI family solute receptor